MKGYLIFVNENVQLAPALFALDSRSGRCSVYCSDGLVWRT